LRGQFHHVIDVMPTVLELAGVEAPSVYNGVPQLPVHGVSLRYTFDEAQAATRRDTQYFEMFTHRAIWHDGWKAVAFHKRGTSYEDDQWELYRLDEDFSECRDLAAERPDVLRALIERWWAEAGKYGVLPLDERGFTERAFLYQPPGSPRLRTRFSLYPGMSRIPSGSAPLMVQRSFRITAHLGADASQPNGVIVSLGDLSGGFTFYVQDSRLVFEYNCEGAAQRVQSAPGAVNPGTRTLGFAFERGSDLSGTGILSVDGTEVGRGPIARTAKWFISWSPLDVGRDSLSRVSDAYTDEFAFTAALQRVDIELEPQARPVDHRPID
jgi:arylsulfatase